MPRLGEIVIYIVKQYDEPRLIDSGIKPGRAIPAMVVDIHAPNVASLHLFPPMGNMMNVIKSNVIEGDYPGCFMEIDAFDAAHGEDQFQQKIAGGVRPLPTRDDYSQRAANAPVSTPMSTTAAGVTPSQANVDSGQIEFIPSSPSDPNHPGLPAAPQRVEPSTAPADQPTTVPELTAQQGEFPHSVLDTANGSPATPPAAPANEHDQSPSSPVVAPADEHQ